jgi:thioredoxin-like negative regulator of GroEL
VNTDESQRLASRYARQAIPTVAVFLRGALVSQVVGVRSVEEYARLLEAVLLRPALAGG